MRIGFLPFHFKVIGIVLLILGLVMGYMVLSLSFKPEYLDVRVFAIYSAYVEKTIFGLTYTNLADEIALVFVLLGLAFMAFSKQKNEIGEHEKLRRNALVIAFLLNTCLLVVLNLLVFGTGFIVILLLNLFSLQIIYLLAFHFLLFRYSTGS